MSFVLPEIGAVSQDRFFKGILQFKCSKSHILDLSLTRRLMIWFFLLRHSIIWKLFIRLALFASPKNIFPMLGLRISLSSSLWQRDSSNCQQTVNSCVPLLVDCGRYYFGVGGGVRDFLHLISQPISPLTARVVRVFDDGQSNIREIVEVARKERRWQEKHR